MGQEQRKKMATFTQASGDSARSTMAPGKSSRTHGHEGPATAPQPPARSAGAATRSAADEGWDAAFGVVSGEITDESGLPAAPAADGVPELGAPVQISSHAIAVAESLHRATLEAHRGGLGLSLIEESIELIIEVSNANDAARATFGGRRAKIAKLIASAEEVDYLGAVLSMATNIALTSTLIRTMATEVRDWSSLWAHVEKKPNDGVNAVKLPVGLGKDVGAFQGKRASVERALAQMSAEIQEFALGLGGDLHTLAGLFTQSEFVEFRHALHLCSHEIYFAALRLGAFGLSMQDEEREQIVAMLEALTTSVVALHARALHVEGLTLAISRGGTGPLGRDRASRSLYDRVEVWVKEHPNDPAVRLVGKPTIRTIVLTDDLVEHEGEQYIVAIEQDSRKQPWRLEIAGALDAEFDDAADEFHPGRVTRRGNPDTPSTSNRVIRLSHDEGWALTALEAQGLTVDHEVRIRFAVGSDSKIVLDFATSDQEMSDWQSDPDLIDQLCAHHSMHAHVNGIQLRGSFARRERRARP